MSCDASHSQQAKHNKEFLNKIKSFDFFDWTVTVMFYTALHYIDFFLAKKNIHPVSHRDRSNIVGRKLGFNIYEKFRELENFCFMARYEPGRWEKEITPEKLKDLEDDLNCIKGQGAAFKVA